MAGRVGLGATGSYDADPYSQSAAPLPSIDPRTSNDSGNDDDDDVYVPSSSAIASFEQESKHLLSGDGDARDVFEGHRQPSVSDRESEYQARRHDRPLSQPQQSYREMMQSRQQSNDTEAVVRATQVKQQLEQTQKLLAQSRKRARDDTHNSNGDDDVTEQLDWDETSLSKPRRRDADNESASDTDEDNDIDTNAINASRWDATPQHTTQSQSQSVSKRVSRWDATPLITTPSNTVNSWDATPKLSTQSASLFDATPSLKKSRWDETPMIHSKFAATPAHTGAGTASALTMEAYRLQLDVDERNKPWTDEELNALLPGADDGYEILQPPESYKPIRTPARKMLAPPTMMSNDGFFIPSEALSNSLNDSIPMLPSESGLPTFTKPEDSQYFGSLYDQSVDESKLTGDQLKKRRILKLLLKIKNGTPPQRKSAMRVISDKAREFGAGPLFDCLLPLLMSPTLDDSERHILVKVIDRVLYRLDDLVRPYVSKILIVIEPLLIDEDYYARVEGREIISNLSKAAGLATMIATMRPDIDNADEYVRNTTARAFAVVASALGIPALLPFVVAVCKSKKSWEARHTGMKIIQQIAILMGMAVLSRLPALIDCVKDGLGDDSTKVKCISALSIAALAEASYPYGIEAFDPVLRPLWLGVKQQRGKTLAAYIKAIGFIIPLMDVSYSSYYTKEVLPIIVREFGTNDEEMKKILLKVLKQLCQSDGLDRHSILTQILGEFFHCFWNRRTAMDKRNHRDLIDTTMALTEKIGAKPVVERLVKDLKDENPLYRKMCLECCDRVLALQGTIELDDRVEQELIDGCLYIIQQQNVDELTNTHAHTNTGHQVMTSFGNIVQSLNVRCKPHLPQIAGIIKWRLNHKSSAVRGQSAELIAKIAPVMRVCHELPLLSHLSMVCYEFLGEEYPEVLASLLQALNACLTVLGLESMQPSIKDLLPRLTPILKNRHESVSQHCIELIGSIADIASSLINPKEWMRISFELLELLKAPKLKIRRVAVKTFGLIAKSIGPHDVLATLLNHLRVQDRQNRVCCCVAIAIVAEQCAPFTVLPALLNEYSVPELNVQNGVLKALSFVFEYIGELGKDYIYACLPLLEDALTDRDPVHRQIACNVVKHMALASIGLEREDAFVHCLNLVWPNIFETSPHLASAVYEAIESIRAVIGPHYLMNYLVCGLFHPARFVRQVYWRLYNSMIIACQDACVACYPAIPNDTTAASTVDSIASEKIGAESSYDFTRHELLMFL